jgi:hypothetical protein
MYQLLESVFSAGAIKPDVGMKVDARYPGGAQRELEALNQPMPDEITQEMSWQAEEEASSMKATALIVQQMVKHRALKRSAIASIRNSLLSDTQSQMRTAYALSQQDLRFQEAVINHNVLTGGAQRAMKGYAEAIQNTRSLAW